MNERDQQIVKGILGFLDKLRGGQSIETIIHAHVQQQMRFAGEPPASLAEFQGCLVLCDQRGYILGVSAKVTQQMKWSLSDEGKAALIELR